VVGGPATQLDADRRAYRTCTIAFRPLFNSLRLAALACYWRAGDRGASRDSEDSLRMSDVRSFPNLGAVERVGKLPRMDV
jgi:hypothetical protein